MFLLTFSLATGSASPAQKRDLVESAVGAPVFQETKEASPGGIFSVTPMPHTNDDGNRRRRRFDASTERVANARELNDQERQAILDAHNQWRNDAALGNLNGGKKATKMQKMYWDLELEEHSKKFSRFCHWGHSQNVGWSELNYSYGENLYATSADFGIPADQGVGPWSLEHQYYNHDTGGCSNEPCGHYTQVVWEDSTRVGCAITECSSATDLPASWGGLTILVCQYYMPGNWVGRKPYTFSTDGTVGSECENGMDSQWPGLCNNPNEICGDQNRCTAVQVCESGTPLNGEDTTYECGMGDCSFVVESGVQVRNGSNGMYDMGQRKYCYDYQGEGSGRATCEDWCFRNKDASPPCLGVTTDLPSNPGFWFPVTTVTDIEAVAGGATSSIDCSGNSGPTPSPATPSPVTPTPAVTPSPSSAVTPSPSSAVTPSPSSAVTPSPTSAVTPTPTAGTGGFSYVLGNLGDNACPAGYSRMTSATATEQDCRDAAGPLTSSLTDEAVEYRSAEETNTWPNGCYANPFSSGYRLWYNTGDTTLEVTKSSSPVICRKASDGSTPAPVTPAPTHTPTTAAPTNTPAPTTPAPTFDGPAPFVRGDAEGCPAGYSRMLPSTETEQECHDGADALTALLSETHLWSGDENTASWPLGCYVYGSTTRRVYWNTGAEESFTKSTTAFVCKGDANDAVTSAPTNAVTSAPTNAVTSAPTNPVTSAPTNAVTSAPTNPVTSAPTNPVTSAPTNAVTSSPTNAVTSSPTNPVTSAPTKAVTSSPTNAVTSSPTNAVTSSPTNAVTPAPTTPAPTTPSPTMPTQAFVRGDDQGNCPEHYERVAGLTSSEQDCRNAETELTQAEPGSTVVFEAVETVADWPTGCYIIDSAHDCFKPQANHFELFFNAGGDQSVTKQGAVVMCKLSGVAPAPTPLPTNAVTASPTNQVTPSPVSPTPFPTPAATMPVPAPIAGNDVFVQGSENSAAGYSCPEGYSRMTTGISTEQHCDTAALTLSSELPTLSFTHASVKYDETWPNGCYLYSYNSPTKGTCYTVYWNPQTNNPIQRRNSARIMCVLDAYTESNQPRPVTASPTNQLTSTIATPN